MVACVTCFCFFFFFFLTIFFFSSSSSTLHSYGSNKDLENEGIKKYMYPMLVDDFTLLETYQWNSSNKNNSEDSELPVPIEAFGASEDTRYTKEQISAWARHTSVQFKEKWFEGKHRYIVDEPQEVKRHIAYDMFGCMAV